MVKNFLYFVAICYFSFACQSKEPEVLVKGSLSCLEKSEKFTDKTRCEISAGVVNRNFLFAASDKENGMILYDINKLYDEKNSRRITPISRIIFPKGYKVSKMESAVGFDDLIIAVGSYIRDDEKDYSKIVSFTFDKNTMESSNFKIIAGDEIRPYISDLFSFNGKKVDYFKIEATTIIKDKDGKLKFLFGVREAGKGYKDGEFNYYVRILSVDINFDKISKTISLDNTTWKIVYDMSSQLPNNGISDLFLLKDTLYMLTTLEQGNELSGNLWKIKLDDFWQGKSFEKISHSLFKGHKPEAVMGLENGKRFLVIADDDRKKTHMDDIGGNIGDHSLRSNDESPYWIIEVD
jgi:hypothetical protein